MSSGDMPDGGAGGYAWASTFKRDMVIALSGEVPMESSAVVRVYSGKAPRAALQLFATEFEEATGHKVVFTFDGVSGIRRRLASGEKGDVILLPAPMIDAMDQIAALRPGSGTVLARSTIGAVVRQDGPLPDIPTPELESYVVYAGAVAVDSASPEPALAFLRLLSHPAKQEHWQAAGFEQALALVFIAGSVREAERAEAALISAAVDYCLEAEDFTQGILSSRRAGVGFYVIEDQAARARDQLRKAELKSGIIEADT